MNATALLLLAAALPAATSDQVVVRRFAFVAAANDGGDARPRLRYAVTDARALAGVLEELGGVAPADRVLVVEPTRAELLASFDRLEERLVAAREQDAARLELIFYYSGHSDDVGLLLGDDLVTYDDLKARLDMLSADVRIAILDSCASGAITRKKGGKHRPPFLVDRSSQVKGYAVLTSSSEDEAAQESDRIGGSFFTHYLVSGLRGAADVTTDGRVTLNEAYAFAFHETLRRTEKTLAGAQHAAYDIQLVGSGDLVMTDIKATSATLGLPEALAGRVFVRDGRERLVAELEKPAGRRVELGLAPGRYEVTFESKRSFRRGSVDLAEGRAVDLDPTRLETIEGEETYLRGDHEPDDTVYFDFGVLPVLSLNANRRVENHAALSLGWTHSYRLTGVALALAAASTSERMTGAQLATGVTWVDGAARGAQLSVGVNWARRMTGAQLTAGVNVADELVGVQATSGINVVSDGYGAQLGNANFAGTFVGMQLGLLNVASNARGFQLGLVNVASKSDGFQLGLLNVSDENEGESFGLLSFSLKGGILRPAVWSSDVGLASAGLKLGTRHIYTIFTVGTSMPHRSEAWSYGGGFGVTVPVSEDLRVDIDSVFAPTYAVRNADDLPDQIISTRVTIGWRATEWLTLFGGPAYHVLVDTDAIDPEARLAPSYAWSHGERVKSWIGWSVGAEVF